MAKTRTVPSLGAGSGDCVQSRSMVGKRGANNEPSKHLLDT